MSRLTFYDQIDCVLFEGAQKPRKIWEREWNQSRNERSMEAEEAVEVCKDRDV